MTETLLVLLQRACLGRLALSFLPPGELGSHRPAAWLRTWAASHFVGGVLWSAIDAWCGRLGVTLDARVAIGLVALVVIVRWLTLPAGMVPRHAPPSERAGFVTWALRLAWIGAALAVERGPLVHGDARTVGDVLAAGVFVEHALGVARRAPWARAALAFAWTVVSFAGSAFERASAPVAAQETSATNTLATAALSGAVLVSGWVAWRRRADARALALAALATGSLVIVAPWLAATVAAVVWLYTAPSARRRVLVAFGLAALALAAPHVGSFAPKPLALEPAVRATFAAVLDAPRAWGLWAAVVLALCAASFGLAGGSLRGRGERACDPPERELAGLAVWLVLAPLFAVAATALVGVLPASAAADGSAQSFAALGACGVVLVGLVFAPDERVALAPRDAEVPAT
ncbi:MAG: hypothetical protein L6Q99_08815 [Planctomycetes bacterium]|nr:hypothetical protein [Planctomycetota bacterium]